MRALSRRAPGAVFATVALVATTQLSPSGPSAASSTVGARPLARTQASDPPERRARSGEGRALAADDFVDSIGVNTHLFYADTTYAQFDSIVLPRLRELGVRHVRDAVDTTAEAGPQEPYYQQLRALASTGIRFDLVTSLDAQATTDYTKLSDVVAWTGNAVHSFEGVNEPDLAVPGDWVSATRRSQAQLSAAVSAMGPGAPEVVLPSVTTREAAKALGSLSADGQAGNVHTYFGDYHPETTGNGDGGYGSLKYNEKFLSDVIGPGLPVVNTESGYFTSPTFGSGVPPVVAGIYTSRLLISQFAAGVERTYLYELLDERQAPAEPQFNFGLLTADGTPKPAFRAVSNMIKLLADPGPAFRPGRLRMSLRGGTSSVRHATLQKRDGTYYVALWDAAPIWDSKGNRPVRVRPSTVRLDLPASYRVKRVVRLKPNGAMTGQRAPRSVSDPRIAVGSSLSFVEIRKVKRPNG